MTEYQSESQTKKVKQERVADPAAVNLGRVFFWLGIGLGITGLLSFFLPSLITLSTGGEFTEESLTVYITMMAVSFIVMLPAMLMIRLPLFTRHSGVAIAGYFIYVVSMGVLMAGLMMMLAVYVDDASTFVKTAGMAWLITAGCFAVMGIIGHFTPHMNAIWPLLTTFILGAFILSMVNIFWADSTVSWIVDFVLFAVILLVTAVDMHNISRIAARGAFESDKALAIYCAYVLYCDFISILVRILLYLAVMNRRD